MTTVAIDRSFALAKPAWKWIALLLLLLTGTSIATLVYGAVYEREAKILASEAEAQTQLQNAVLKSELEKQRSLPAGQTSGR